MWDLVLQLASPLSAVPASLARRGLVLAPDGLSLTYVYDARSGHQDMPALLKDVLEAGVAFTDLRTSQSSLEDIFVDLVENGHAPAAAADDAAPPPASPEGSR